MNLGTNATLSGFTVRNGGGVNAEASGVVTNCVLTGNTAPQGCSGGFGSVYNSCGPGRGGGAYGGTLYNCILIGNRALRGLTWSTPIGGAAGGGAYRCTLYNCTLTGNTAADWGGGAYESTLYNCTLTGNSANAGGGAYRSTLYNCTLTGNSAIYGGGAVGSTLYHCTLTGNSGGGISGGTLYNCIVYFNQGANWGADETGSPPILQYCCTTPLPPGPGNFSADPAFASVAHLSASSPCLGAGNPAWATGTDLDGEPWADPPAVGADQVWPGQSTGPLTMQIVADFTEVLPGFPVSFTAYNTGPILRSVWDFGDGTVLTNQPFTSHAWTAPGAYTVRLTGYNDSHPAGVSAVLDVEVIEMVQYVDAANRAPVFPFRTWATAATNIQDAVNASTVVGRLVLVTNGVYQTGMVEKEGSAYRVALTNVVLRSVNGPEVTVIDGNGFNGTAEASCVYVGANAILTGFTSRSGFSAYGVWSEPYGVVTTCVIAAGNGAGAFGGTLYNCVLTRNGGAGASSTRLANCIVYFNNGGNWSEDCTFEYSCTTPLPPGPGNIEADPRFVNPAAVNFRLRPDSPCIDAGTDLTAFLTTDILGLPRPLDGDGDGVARFDMGAYEFALLTRRFAPDARLGSDGFHFTVLGEPGQTVRIERSRDLRSWEAVTTVPALPASGQALLDDGAVGERMLFYRAVSGP